MWPITWFVGGKILFTLMNLGKLSRIVYILYVNGECGWGICGAFDFAVWSLHWTSIDSVPHDLMGKSCVCNRMSTATASSL